MTKPFYLQSLTENLIEIKDIVQKKALITGISGQDGSYLAELLLDKGYEVHGLFRRSSTSSLGRLSGILSSPISKFLTLHEGDLSDQGAMIELMKMIQPDELYNLAAQSHVGTSFKQPHYTADVTGLGALRCLEAIRLLGLKDKTRFYQASTSELYGRVKQIPQNEETPFYPRSPYGVAKAFAYWITVNYRDSYDIFACNGILFNHESPRRGDEFVTKKISRGLASIKKGKQACLYLGNLDSLRDWGHARDFVEMQWLMLQQDSPEDYVIATGKQYSVRRFVELAAEYLGMQISWRGSGIHEEGVDASGNILVRVDPQFFRPSEVETLLGDPSKAASKLGWVPRTSFEDLVREMVEHDLKNT